MVLCGWGYPFAFNMLVLGLVLFGVFKLHIMVGTPYFFVCVCGYPI
jgi:hypothetical protein